MKLGFNVSIERKSKEQVIKEIETYLSISNEVIELSLTALHGILTFPFEEIIPLLKKFKYRSIHLPVVTGEDRTKNVFLEYPNKDSEEHIKIIKNIANKIDINSYVLHPDQVTDFQWAKNEFGELLGFENMDNKKSFGKTVPDMEKIFEECPKARFILDVNHIYTNDHTMELAKPFYNAFKERLTHYHVSALGKHHDSFINFPDEIEILKGVTDLTIPMVHEGSHHNKSDSIKECLLIKNYLLNNRNSI